MTITLMQYNEQILERKPIPSSAFARGPSHATRQLIVSTDLISSLQPKFLSSGLRH